MPTITELKLSLQMCDMLATIGALQQESARHKAELLRRDIAAAEAAQAAHSTAGANAAERGPLPEMPEALQRGKQGSSAP